MTARRLRKQGHGRKSQQANESRAQAQRSCGPQLVQGVLDDVGPADRDARLHLRVRCALRVHPLPEQHLVAKAFEVSKALVDQADKDREEASLSISRRQIKSETVRREGMLPAFQQI